MASASRAVCLVLVSLALLQCVQGEPPAQQIVQALQEITTQSDDLLVVTQSINIVTAILDGSNIPRGLTAITTLVDEATTLIQGFSLPAGGLPVADAQLVVDALTTSVEALKALLNEVEVKHGLNTLIPSFESIDQSLVQLKATVDTFQGFLIALIPTQVSAANTLFSALSATLTTAIETFQELL